MAQHHDYLCVARATALYAESVAEMEIQQCTGHKCLEALGKYERTGEEQQKAISHILVSPVQESMRVLYLFNLNQFSSHLEVLYLFSLSTCLSFQCAKVQPSEPVSGI